MDGDEGNQGPSGKRQRRDGGRAAAPVRAPAAPEFPRGTIKLVKVHNFMTYSGTVVAKPGPRLNLVLGPNGTGKSSLVCALCIGLGGRPQLLGRAENLKDFIRRGCSEAWTEITLSGGGASRDMVVRREIRQVAREDGQAGYSSKWRLNGTEARQEDVLQLTRDLNIQFDNLCQFLPQDRVVQFAHMDPYQLLEATQKAIGDAALNEQHKQLIDKSKEAKTLKTSLEAQRRQLERLEAENKALERDAERFRRRQQLQRSIDDVSKKEVWATVAGHEQVLAADETALQRAKDMLQQCLDEAAGDAAPLTEARRRAKEARDKLQAMERNPAAPSAQQFTTRRRRLAETVGKHVEDFTVLQDRIGKLQDKSDELREHIRRSKEDLAAKQAAFAALPPLVDNTAAMEALREECDKLREQMAELDPDLQDLSNRQTQLRGEMLRIRQAIQQLDSTRHQRLSVMDQVRPGIKDLAGWLAEQWDRGTFQGPALGPLGMEMTLRDAGSHARVVEAACRNMLLDFAVTCEADQTILTAEMQRRGLRGSSVQVVERPLDSPLPQLSGPASSYARYGVQCSVADLVDAPPLVMHALAGGSAAIASAIFVTDDSHLDDLMRQPQLRTVYTADSEHRVIKSKYNSEVSRQITELYPPRFLGGAGANSDPQARQREHERLSRAEAELAAVGQQLGELERRRAGLEDQLAAKNQEGRRLFDEQQNSVRANQTAQRHIKVAENQLRGYQEKPDPLASKPQLEAQQRDAVEKHFAAMKDLAALVRAQWVGVRERGAAELALKEADMQIHALESATSERKEKEARAKDKVKKCEQLVAKSKKQVERAREQAELEAPLTAALKRRLDELPDDPAELAARRQELEDEVAAIVCNNPRALEEFQERSRAIDDLRRETGAQAGDLAVLEGEIDAIRSEWLPELQAVVGHVNAAFGTAFAKIGCAGEVQLDTGSCQDDYDKYSIQIRVKFRSNEDLQLLTATRQSGGERSVSTILYLLALQGVTATPFRVVDEINQGMDAINERKVFGQLVAASTQEGTPQCFLLTPKLLPDLDYGDDITILQIMNGAITTGGGGGFGSAGAATWDISSLLGANAVALAARG